MSAPPAGPTGDHRLTAARREKLAALGPGAYPNDFNFNERRLAGDLQRRHQLDDAETLSASSEPVRVAGRIMRHRGAFLSIQDMSGSMQLYVNRQTLDADMLAAIKQWDLGDIVGAAGPLRRSRRGDLYVDIQECRLLCKALRPMPDKFHGLADRETRYRQRYLDLLANAETRRVFELRHRLVDALRSFFASDGFVEVETPMLHPLPGGAAARPFRTHHLAMNRDLFLRVAPELYLKRLLVGGMEKVFELNRNFRNEGLSTRHNPEFTMLEWYRAYADYRDAMSDCEKLLLHLAQTLHGEPVLSFGSKRWPLDRPLRRQTMRDAVLERHPALSAEMLDGDCAEAARRAGIEPEAGWSAGKTLLEIFEQTVERQLEEPTFITAYPAEVSPLARPNDQDPGIADRFELFIAGQEIANGFSELNDPELQAARFREQAEQRSGGDDEAMRYDSDYIVALEHGMPPAAGAGIGVDRLAMLFTDQESIRDVLLFPQLRDSPTPTVGAEGDAG